MPNKFEEKRYGRIYVLNPEDVERVRDVIKELDEYEYEYLPDDLVAPFSEYPRMVYTHKFNSICMNDLTAVCWSRGIMMWACMQHGRDWSEMMPNAIAMAAKKREALA